jgi:hypothetical protein
MLGEGQAGSWALSRDQSGFFLDSLNSIADNDLAGVINKHAIPQLVKMNWPRVTRFPKLKHDDLGQLDLGIFADNLGKFVSSGFLSSPDQNIEEQVREMLGVPEMTDEQRKQALMKDKQKERQLSIDPREQLNVKKEKGESLVTKGKKEEKALAEPRIDLGGPGSGHHGHVGIPGHRGGSAPKGSLKISLASEDLALSPGVLSGDSYDARHQDRNSNTLFEMMADHPDNAPSSYGEFTYETAYGAVQADIQDYRAFELADEWDMDGELVVGTVAAWTAGPNNPNSYMVLNAVSEKFDAPIPDYLKENMEKAKSYTGGMKTYSDMEDRDVDVLPLSSQDASKLVDNMYKETQSYFKDQGITHVHLMRGVMPEGLETTDKGSWTQIPKAPITSWTSSRTMANTFAEAYDGHIMATDIPVERILSFPLTGIGSLSEGEFLVIGRKDYDLAEIIQ